MSLPFNKSNLSTIGLSSILQPRGDLSFSRRPISKKQALIEVVAASISTTDGIVLCIFRAEPFGTKIIDFSEATNLPEPGQFFSVPFSLWVSGPNYKDFTLLGARVLVSPKYIYRPDRGVLFQRFNQYQASALFNLPLYHLNFSRFKFGVRKKRRFSYPTVGGGPLFFMGRFFAIFRSWQIGWRGQFEMLRSLQFTPRYLFLKSHSSLWFHARGRAVLEHSVSWQILHLLRVLRGMRPRRTRRKKRLISFLYKICSAKARIKLVSPILTPADSLRSFTFMNSAIGTRISSVFALFIVCAILPVNAIRSAVCSTFLHYPPLAGHHGKRRIRKHYSPLARSGTVFNGFRTLRYLPSVLTRILKTESCLGLSGLALLRARAVALLVCRAELALFANSKKVDKIRLDRRIRFQKYCKGLRRIVRSLRRKVSSMYLIPRFKPNTKIVRPIKRLLLPKGMQRRFQLGPMRIVWLERARNLKRRRHASIR